MPETDSTPAPTLSPAQAQLPLAMVAGEPMTQIPQGLYIPPDALEVFLDAFEGPLDLLLYLIKRQNLDILNIPLAEITRQYMDYIGIMKEMKLELAAEYLVMAAMLAEIKSRLLLPRPVEIDHEDDPRAELVRRLQEYERFKDAAQNLDELPRMGRDVYDVAARLPEVTEKLLPKITLQDLIHAANDVMKRADQYAHHHIVMEPLSVRERMTWILSEVKSRSFIDFTSLFTVEEGKQGVIVSFLAILELLKAGMIDIVQTELYAPIHVKVKEIKEIDVDA
ncbi:segregation/condensation protein A [Gammaproteobacteria bacterium AH-315-C21]|nr:segregation/condensation protein A [Gammaproteobacteria bacterium AH-315-C21]